MWEGGGGGGGGGGSDCCLGDPPIAVIGDCGIFATGKT